MWCRTVVLRHRLRLAIFCATLVILVTLTALAQRRSFPTFEQYPVKLSTAKVHDLDPRSHPVARRYRTLIRREAQKGVNFAGHYVFQWWGLGTNIGGGAIMDARTGRVVVPRQLDQYGWGLEMYKHAQNFFSFTPNSRLLIFYGMTAQSGWGTHYLLWNGARLREVALDTRTDESN